LIKVVDRACYGGRARVFDPDPLTGAQATYQAGGQFVDNSDNDTDSLVAQIVCRTLPEIAFSGNQYHLEGSYAKIEDFEAPFKGLFPQTDSIWNFTRQPDGFEAANVYYHLDKSMRYINDTLGFNLMPYQYPTGVQFDPHGLNSADNSHYISSTGRIAWGEGGVDDSEDPDVILHELGHGLHDWVTNGGLSQVDGLSEGCGDYWASSYNRYTGFWTPTDPQYYWVFQWDGHNEFWAGRVTNYPATYPGGLVGQVHSDSQIWASTLMQIWDDIGRRATDENFLEALSMLNGSSNQADAAQAFVQADVNLHGGANLVAIEHWFNLRGYNVTIPLIGPAPPEDLAAYSDYRTPASIQLNWTDPSHLVTGDTLLPGTFNIHIERDGSYLDSIPSGTEIYVDSGLVDGQLYTYSIFAQLDSLPIVSQPVQTSWISGGSPIPTAPLEVAIANLGNQVKFSWRNPSVNIDDTPMDDYAGINLYRNGALVSNISLASADTSRIDSTYFTPPSGGFHSWYLTAIDNESPQNESTPSPELITPLNAPMGDLFINSGAPDSSLWRNVNTNVNEFALNPPSGLNALNLNGKPHGDDMLDLYPTDLGSLNGSGVVFSYFYQPQGQGNAPEAGDSLLVYFKNSVEEWILVRGYPGNSVQPFQQELIDLNSAPSGSGSYFHSQFQVRFKSIGSPSFTTPNDDWFIDNIYLGIPAPLITASSTALWFDTTFVDSTRMLELAIFNAGIDTLSVSNVISDNNDFTTNINSFQLGDGGSQLLEISFTPSQAGLRTGRLSLVSNDPGWDTLSIALSGFGEDITVLERLTNLPRQFAIYQNYPNPFNPSTTISYELPKSSEVSLVVYNLLGQKVRTLVNGNVKAGRHKVRWSGRNDRGQSVASGIYIYRFEAGDYQKTVKMILLK
jgi:hypothetical protein